MSHPTITIQGNMTRDPEIKWTQNGTCYTRFSIATNRYTKNQSGQWEQQGNPLFLNCIAWQTTAETIADNVKKGDSVLAIGTLEPNNWTDNGQQHRDVQVRVDRLAIVPKNTRQAPQEGNQIGQDPWTIQPGTRQTAQGQPQQPQQSWPQQPQPQYGQANPNADLWGQQGEPPF